MTEYKCVSCNKVFERNWNLIRHYKRKNSCLPPPHNVSTKKNKIPHKKSKSTKHKKSLKCNYCKKTYSRSDSLFRHQKSYCKVIKKNESDREQIFQNLIMKVTELEKENQKLKESNNQICQKAERDINNNTVNNNTTINNNTINNTIKLIAFGKEDLNFITDSTCTNILHKSFKSIETLTHYTHFNKNKPEYHNIYISNMRDNYVMIFDGTNWNLHDRENIIDDIVNMNMGFLTKKFHILENELPENTLKRFNNFLGAQYDEQSIKVIKDELKLLLYNKKDLPLATKKLLENNDQIETIEDNQEKIKN